jgi:hypothetical protein
MTGGRRLRGLARDDPNNTVIPSDEPRRGEEAKDLLRSPVGRRGRGSGDFDPRGSEANPPGRLGGVREGAAGL